MEPLATIPSSLRHGLPATMLYVSPSGKWGREINEKFPVNIVLVFFHLKVLKEFKKKNKFIIQGNLAQLLSVVSATRQHEGNNEKLGAKPKERIYKAKKTEINGSESFQVQTAAVI